MNKKLLISFEEYQKLPPNKVPYTYVVSNKKQFLYYFGSKHSYEKDHPQFVELKDFFEDFVQKTTGKDRVAFTEGGERRIADSEENAITKYGEMGYISYLANQNHIEVYSPEPTRTLVYQDLAKKFSKEEIQYYFFASMIPQWNRMVQKPSFEEWIKSSIEYDKKHSRWDDFDFSLEHMKVIHQKIFNKPFDPNDELFSKQVVNPTIELSIINKVARFVSEHRNEHIVDEIERYWKEGKSIFTIYGSTHAVLQEPVLRTLE